MNPTRGKHADLIESDKQQITETLSSLMKNSAVLE